MLGGTGLEDRDVAGSRLLASPMVPFMNLRYVPGLGGALGLAGVVGKQQRKLPPLSNVVSQRFPCRSKARFETAPAIALLASVRTAEPAPHLSGVPVAPVVPGVRVNEVTIPLFQSALVVPT